MGKIKLTPKQTTAWKLLYDNQTKELLYGGAAGGGKSFLGCLWIINNSWQYPGSRYLIGRSKLKALKETTLNTFFDVCKVMGYKKDEDYTYNSQTGIITWSNESEIILKDLFAYPSDPNFDSLGSLEITGAFIDEANQITHKAKQVVFSRIRYKLDQFGLTSKLLMTCNPAKNWVYTEFYKKNNEGTLEPQRKFIAALATDNPNTPKQYIENLQTLSDLNLKERLLYGNWEYDDDPAKLMDYDALTDLFSNEGAATGQKYITADIARMGTDKTVIMVWNGYRVTHITTINQSDLVFVKDKIRQLATEHNVPISKVICDEDGLGGGVVDMLKCKGFKANQSSKEYANMKSECYFKMSYAVNDRKVWIIPTDHKQEIISELEIIKRKNIDKDQKPAVISKDEMKQLLNHSPDFADALMMRWWFESNKKEIFGFA